MIQPFFLLAIILDCLHAVYLYDYGETTQGLNLPSADLEFEPVTIFKHRNKAVSVKEINCDDFTHYALNCTVSAAFIYNSSKRSPPLPSKIGDWCRSIEYLTNCAIDWNSDCKDVTESHFNEESIRGHMHVIENICEDESFRSRYESVESCINAASDTWETCYSTFNSIVNQNKNSTFEWTHYKTHFYLCCARALFRRCTLDYLFHTTKCTREQSITLQKFSVILSESDVYQDCENNVMYNNCPGGDPRPSGRVLANMMNAEMVEDSSNTLAPTLWFICLPLFRVATGI